MKMNPTYTISNFTQPVRKSDLYVNSFGRHLEHHDFIEKPHRHNFYLMVLFTQGHGKHSIDFDQFDIKPGSLFLVQPGQIHNWELSENIEGYIIFYSQQVYDVYFGNKKLEDYPFYQSANAKPELQLEEAQLHQLLPYFELLLQENLQSQSKSPDKLLNLIDVLHIEISRIYFAAPNHAAHLYSHKVRQFEKLLEQHYKSEKAPSFYAQKMHMTLKHLNRICKTQLNETLTTIIAKRVILEAKRLLANKDLSVAQVADALGYENYPYFGKLFKKYAGCTPGEFRGKIQ